MGNQYGQMGYNQSVYTPPMSTYMPQMPQMANSQQFQVSPIPLSLRKALSNPPQQFPEYQQMPMQSYGSPAMQPSPQPGASWVQPPFQPSPRLGQQYANSNPQQRTPVQGTTIPYAYGQLPASASTNPADPKSQHPIPGSFNRHAFNPKTQSFVPGGGAVSRSGSQQGSQHGSPQPMRYGGFASPHLQSQQQFQGGMGQMGGFGIQMSRQSSNASMGGMPVQMQSGVRSYHASPHMMARPLPLPQQYPNQVQMQMQQGVQMMPMMQAQQMQGGVQMQQMQQAVLVPSMNGHGQTGQMTLMTPGSVQMGAALQNVGGVVMLNLQHPANQPVQNQQMQGQGPQIMGQMGGGMMQGQMMGGGGYQGQGGQGQGQMGYYPPGPQGQGPKGPGQA